MVLSICAVSLVCNNLFLPSPVQDYMLTFFFSVSLPELIAQTNMDAQSVTKLRDEVAKLTSWMGKNSTRWFTAAYEAATQDYIEKARGQ